MNQIEVIVETQYLPEQSDPEQNKYVFAYTITIANTGTLSAQLLRRHWIITDANEQVQEVAGEGVIGEQPHIAPGECYQYTSGAILETNYGHMRGSYRMINEDGELFDAPIAAFTLAQPTALH